MVGEHVPVFTLGTAFSEFLGRSGFCFFTSPTWVDVAWRLKRKGEFSSLASPEPRTCDPN